MYCMLHLDAEDRKPWSVRVTLAATLLIVATLADAPAIAGEGRMIAAYGDAITKADPPPGWSFLWNPRGGVSDSGNCVPLTRIEGQRGRRKKVMYGVPDHAGAVAANRPRLVQYGGVSAVRDSDGAARYAIAAYAMQEDAAGEIWVNQGNLLNTGYPESVIEIYLNGELRLKASAKRDRVPLLFRTRLGRLRKGDVVRVAVGPGERSATGGGRLCFVIEEWPVGAEADEPVNILAPPITAAEPKRDHDGSHRTYSAKHELLRQEVAAKKPKLVFLGDSITARLPAELLRQRYGRYRPVNLGIGGDWVQNVLWRVRNGTLNQASIKVVVLLIGTNNLANRFTPDEVASGIGRIVEAIHEKAPRSKLLLLGIFPRGRSRPDSRANKNVRAVNAKLSAMADGKKIYFLDIGDKLTEPDGSVSKEVMPDGLHVGGRGFNRWLDAMDPAFQQLLAAPVSGRP